MALLIGTTVPLSAQKATVVKLNGDSIAFALPASRATDGFVVPVPVLARAVDGADTAKARLQVNGARLIAARLGGCHTCPVRVTRTVVISSRLRDVAGTPAIPMDDLVGAFEGRLRVDSTGTQLDIHVGRCTWCILEPAPKQSLDRR